MQDARRVITGEGALIEARYARELEQGARRLAFSQPFEARFRADYSDGVVRQRLILLVIVALAVLTQPLMDRLLLHPPAAFIPLERQVQFLLMLPVTLLAIVVTALPATRRYADQLALLVVIAISAGLIYQRRVGASLDFHVPSLLLATAQMAGFLVAGLRFRVFLPVALFLYATMALNEVAMAEQVADFSLELQFETFVTLLGIGGGYLHELYHRRAWLREQLLVEHSARDPLTGLLNRRAFHMAWDRLFRIARREQRPLGLAMLDIDGFKRLNDTYGHDAGDACLSSIAKLIGGHAAQHGATCARYGGEEFVILWYGANLTAVSERCEALRRGVAGLSFPAGGDASFAATISIGAAWFTPDAELGKLNLLRVADQALYEAKETGRDRVVLIDSRDGILEAAIPAAAGGHADHAPVDAEGDDTDALGEAHLRALERQHQHELRRLWFDGRMETEFHDDYFDDRRGARAIALCLTVFFMMLTPLVDSMTPGIASGFVQAEFWTQYVLMLPPLLAATYFTAVRPKRLTSGALTAVAVAMIGLGGLYQRYVGAGLGVNFPYGTMPLIVIGALVLGRLRFVTFSPVIVAVIAASIWTEFQLGHPASVLNYDVHALLIFSSVMLVGGYLGELDARRAWLRKRLLQQWSTHDSLTGVLNRRSFNEQLQRLFALARSESRPIAIALIDVDHFKAFNDLYGHIAGDDCLMKIADTLSWGTRRGGDVLARLGGEEFACVWYGLDLAATRLIVHEMRVEIERLAISHTGSPHGAVVTASVGACWAVPKEGDDPAAMLNTADKCLYQCKAQGRNRERVAEGIGAA